MAPLVVPPPSYGRNPEWLYRLRFLNRPKCSPQHRTHVRVFMPLHVGAFAYHFSDGAWTGRLQVDRWFSGCGVLLRLCVLFLGTREGSWWTCDPFL